MRPYLLHRVYTHQSIESPHSSLPSAALVWTLSWVSKSDCGLVDMSDLPAGAVLTSIDGRKCTAIPRNATSPENAVTATSPPAADPSGDTQGGVPPGGILMEAPVASGELLSLSSALSIPDATPEPTETIPGAASSSTSPEGQFRMDGADEAEAGTDEDEVLEPSATESLPEGTPVSEEPSTDDGDETDEGSPAPTSEGLTDGTESPEQPAQEGSDEDDSSSPTPTSGQAGANDGITQTADGPESTQTVNQGAGRSGDDGDGEDAGDESRQDGSGSGDEIDNGSDESLDGNDSEGDGSDDEDSDGDDDDDDDGGTESDGDSEGGSGGAGAFTSSTGDSFITTTLEGGVVTTIPAPSGNDQSSPTGDSNNDLVGSTNGVDESKQAGIIAGSVIGSLAAVALVGFLLFWFWRKRSQRHKYVIQTPVFEPPNSSRTEKTWDFDNGSIGPTNKAARMKEAVEYRFDAIGRKFNKPSPQPSRKSGVNLNRGNSQHYAAGALPPQSRDNHDLSPHDDELSNRDRLTNWWSRTREDANFNWGVRNGMPEAGPSGDLGRRTSSQDFSGALGLMINDARSRGNDPFSDDYAVEQRGQGSSEGYAVHQTPPLRNPFTDANSIQPLPLAATTYDPRGQPGRSRTGSLHRQTSSPLRQQSTAPYHHSGTATPPNRHQTDTPLSRGAVRSDQFDLEIEPHPGTLVAVPEVASTRGNTRANTREGSLKSFTSRVSSLSEDWSDRNNRGNGRGDVGVEALRWADERSPGIGKAS